MNILMIPSWYENKYNKTHGSFFREQAESLEKNGHNVYVLYVDIIRFNEIKRMVSTSKYEAYTKNNLNVYRIKKIKLPRLKEKFVYNMVERGLEELYTKNKYGKIDIDVIHAHSFVWGGCAGLKISEKYNIPIMVTEHYTGYSREIFSESEKYILKSSINRVDKVVAVSSGLKRDMLKYVDSNKEIEVIPNMVDSELFKPKFNIKNEDSDFIFLSVGYLMYKKGFDILLRAFKKAYFYDKNVKLVIGGDGEESNNLKSMAKELEIEDKVQFLGAISRERVAKEMERCNCFVLPSRFETFGVVYIEALAMGKPVIGTDTDAIRDIINEKNGLIINKDSEEELVNALIKIKNEYSKYNHKYISEQCLNKFSEKNISIRISNSLEETIAIHNNI